MAISIYSSVVDWQYSITATINIGVFTYEQLILCGDSSGRAIDDKPRSGDEGDIWPRSYLPHYANRRTLRLDRFSVHWPSLHGESSVAPGLEPVILRPPVRDYNHYTTAATQ
ncbi:hypothetical protein TNCV_1901691 [Trichonephila clavipes]|nr:hypothetical protein TNCV_1901691 [Trichonephila clavipes]